MVCTTQALGSAQTVGDGAIDSSGNGSGGISLSEAIWAAERSEEGADNAIMGEVSTIVTGDQDTSNPGDIPRDRINSTRALFKAPAPRRQQLQSGAVSDNFVRRNLKVVVVLIVILILIVIVIHHV
jgi:hypothetical protein